MVFLDSKDLPITYANVNPNRRQLVHRYLGPYKVIKFVGPNAVELELPNDMRIHDVVNVGRLKIDNTRNAERISVPPPPPPPPVRATKTGNTFAVERILEHLPDAEGSWQYKVKWEGWGNEANTWEPEANLGKAIGLVEEYWEKRGGRPLITRRHNRKRQT
jgi:hypothetical protein